MTDAVYFVALFDSVSHAMKAEKILKLEGVPHKIIPVPKEISSDCGICLRFDREIIEKLKSVLDGKVDVREFRSLPG